MPLEPGFMVGERIRLVRLLREGGMGSVWLADHLTLRTPVAVKFMAPGRVADTTVMARFTLEASAAAQLKCSNVIQVFDFGIEERERHPYIVMEFLEGEDLGERIVRGGPLPIEETAAIVAQTCRALTRAHALGIIHRDIKPDNIFLVTTDGELLVKVLDFGIAKRQQDSMRLGVTGTGMLVGTPHYMSPEQTSAAKDIDFHTDLWSLGVVAYHALTGDVPFEGETLNSLSAAIREGLFASPSSIRKDLPHELDAWFARALNRQPSQRFASAKEMSDAFQTAIGRGKAAPSELFGAGPVLGDPSTGAGPLLSASITNGDTQKPRPRWAFIAAGAGMVAVAGITVALEQGLGLPSTSAMPVPETNAMATASFYDASPSIDTRAVTHPSRVLVAIEPVPSNSSAVAPQGEVPPALGSIPIPSASAESHSPSAVQLTKPAAIPPTKVRSRPPKTETTAGRHRRDHGF